MQVRALAKELVAEISSAGSECGDELLSVFVSEVVLSAADQRRRAERKQHQMECITAAKERGVRFGASRKPLPDNFEYCYQAWQDGELSMREAAESCGMPRVSFKRAVDRRKEEGVKEQAG